MFIFTQNNIAINTDCIEKFVIEPIKSWETQSDSQRNTLEYQIKASTIPSLETKESYIIIGQYKTENEATQALNALIGKINGAISSFVIDRAGLGLNDIIDLMSIHI